MRLHTPPVSTNLPLDVSVYEHVRMQTNGLIQGLHVDVISGHVVLTGHAASYYAKQLASHAAMHVLDDALELSNNIEVN